MKKITLLFITFLVISTTILIATRAKENAVEEKTVKSIYDFALKDIDGKEIKLDQYKGQVLLLVNVASRCGYTPQYQGLQKIYDKYKDQGFVVLGFPANNFGGQEPGTDKEIKTFCSTRFNVAFPIFSKISVKGEDKHALYKYLTEKETNAQFAGEISWNFNKFLVDKTGHIVARFDSKDEPESEKVREAIESAIAAGL